MGLIGRGVLKCQRGCAEVVEKEWVYLLIIKALIHVDGDNRTMLFFVVDENLVQLKSSPRNEDEHSFPSVVLKTKR